MSASLKKSKFDQFVEEKFLPLDRNKKLLIYAFLFILPLVLFYFLAYSPKSEEIKNLQTQVANAREELKKVRIASRDLPKHQKELEEAKAEFEATSVLLPKSQEIPNLLRSISDLGKNAGLDFISFVPGPEVPKDFYAEIPIDIRIRGPYHNMGLFLDKVSKLERIVTVDNIRTDKVEQDGSEILLNSTCRLLTYRFTNVKLEPPKPKK